MSEELCPRDLTEFADPDNGSSKNEDADFESEVNALEKFNRIANDILQRRRSERDAAQLKDSLTKLENSIVQQSDKIEKQIREIEPEYQGIARKLFEGKTRKRSREPSPEPSDDDVITSASLSDRED